MADGGGYAARHQPFPSLQAMNRSAHLQGRGRNLKAYQTATDHCETGLMRQALLQGHCIIKITKGQNARIICAR